MRFAKYQLPGSPKLFTILEKSEGESMEDDQGYLRITEFEEIHWRARDVLELEKAALDREELTLVEKLQRSIELVRQRKAELNRHG